ncbi:hypothetical protein [Paraburkholderia sp. CNPSo 3281]|uniref:hypothetical protein n=1 Tax=Paraburkholderia sp. CNPSo 3281 TaxID=2940933 RepID=UPI0020B79EB4|nr:hypothetical protein [Paraburkholderia sp. CNPSo 3281]MCP3715430.1 hypothetical protein [Paraburkholderia sp. CNPSo 3281]
MIAALSRLLRRAAADCGNVSCTALEAPNCTAIGGDAPPPSTDDSANPTALVDEEVELMRYLLLSMAAAY